jgi:hypothetical protein
MKVYVARASYEDLQNTKHNVNVGVFSSEKRARAGLESFVEDVLEIEFSDYRDFASEVQRFELDQGWLDNGDKVAFAAEFHTSRTC